MSKIGKKPIDILEGVKVYIDKNRVTVKGPKGELSYKVDPNINIEIGKGKIVLTPKKNVKRLYAVWGLSRALIANMIIGVSKGYEKKLELRGIGYKVAKKENGLELNLGFSHPVMFEAPDKIEFEIDKKNVITISGIDKQLVGQTAADIRNLRKPEPYKGKGIRYVGEKVRRKVGKKVAGVGLM